MEFAKYQHIERFGTIETEGIENGKCYVFPKIDGTNGSIWTKDYKLPGTLCFGSRNRELEIENDNASFMLVNIDNNNMHNFFANNPDLRLFGEWLVPHSLKTYRENSWRKFYVFDVTKDLIEITSSGEKFEYLSYDEYKPILEEYDINYIPCMATYVNGNYEAFLKCLEGNTFLIQDGKGNGEGIVIKNYEYINRYGRRTWAKIVTSEFKEKHTRVMGPTEKSARIDVETHIIDNYCTTALIEKTYAKIVLTNNGWSSKMIPQLIGRVYNDLIVEESWNFVKKYKNPIINYKRLQQLVTQKIKEIKKELF